MMSSADRISLFNEAIAAAIQAIDAEPLLDDENESIVVIIDGGNDNDSVPNIIPTTTTTTTTTIPTTQTQLESLMRILEDNSAKIPEGDYLIGMNALGYLHKKNGKRFFEDSDDDLPADTTEAADRITQDLWGISVYSNYLTMFNNKREMFEQIKAYRPLNNTTVMRQAQFLIMCQIQQETLDEMDNIRQTECECGWRGFQRNFARHCDRNARHLRWVADMATAAAIAATRSQSQSQSHPILIDETPIPRWFRPLL